MHASHRQFGYAYAVLTIQNYSSPSPRACSCERHRLLCSCNFRAVRQLGAESAVDFRKESYSEAVQDINVVIDTLGRETEGAQRMLKEAKGAEYVSLQPKVLKVGRFSLRKLDKCYTRYGLTSSLCIGNTK